MTPRFLRWWKVGRRAGDWLVAQALFALLAALRLLPARRAIGAADVLARIIGPWTPRHRVAVDNLSRAYPEKDAAWIASVAKANWGQMGRLAAEYVFLDDIFDYDPGAASGTGIVEVEGVQLFEMLRERGAPVLFFTGHLGCFELLPVCASAFGLDMTALFRQPNNRTIAKRVLQARRTRSGHLVPSKAGAAWALVSALDRGTSVGMLVDQKFAKGIPATFFGRPCRTNPLLPKLARQFGCDVYPARSVRLPGGRYRLELQPRLDLPRDAEGMVDIAASCQMLNDVVEGWVREHPEQWMWFHRRWRL